MKSRLLLLTTCIALAALKVLAAVRPELEPVDLRCEYAQDPLGVDTLHPRLFWKLESTARGEFQTAYQVLVSSSPDRLAKDQGDLWDSGTVKTNETIQIAYAGQPLKSSQAVSWKVRVWDREGRASAWSPPASWTMGVMDFKDWRSAKWIGLGKPGIQNLLLRSEFVVKPNLQRAVIHICGLGQYELWVNGRKAGQDLLAPGWTKYNKTCLYDTRDLTALLHPGSNAIGITLVGGMYNVQGGRYTKFKGSFGLPKAIAVARLDYEDGSVESLHTDENWRATRVPSLSPACMAGLRRPARAGGWDQPGFANGEWVAAIPATGPGGRLRGLSGAAPPVGAFEPQAG